MEEYLTFAKYLALKSGEIMKAHFVVGVDRQTKGDSTPVTIADTTINKIVIDSIKEKYPKHSVIGEEDSLGVFNSEYVWVCDPIDGTIPYTFGIATNVFSIALVSSDDGQPKVAVVYDPYMGRMYSAVKGQGAFLNDKKIEVNKINSISDGVIGMSGTKSSIVDAQGIKGALIYACWRPLILNCVIYEAMLVATGQIIASVFPGDTVHDIVTAKLIVEEAGGRVTDMFGGEQRYDKPINGAVISNGLVHEQIVKIVNKHKKAETSISA
jgi:myo-inositol-1(or 4)-monophosphatase